MMNKRTKLITLSATLCGLALVLTAPAAHGHGNNPKGPYTGSIDPKDPQMPGGPDAVDWPSPGGGNTHLDIGSLWSSDGRNIDIPREMIVRDITVLRLPDIDPGGDASISIGPAEMLPKTHFGGSPSAGGVPRAPRGGAIPTPGTLGLLGVAALALRRRRRRR
jgi:hypothetical protein